MVRFTFKLPVENLLVLLFFLLSACSPPREEAVPEFRIEPAVNFLPAAPVIDGELDDSLQHLPVRPFRFLEKSSPENPVVEPTFRLAYGTDFFYLFVEAPGDSLIVRDRAYQNGDGLQLLFAIPDSSRRETDEFYVLGFSPRQDSRQTWQHQFVWYRNRALSFRRLKDTRFKARAKNGKIGFEVLIPWKEIYPYHPWYLPQTGFNLCYVQAVGRGEKNYYFLVEDERLQSEQSSRLYAGMRFEPPAAGETVQMFAVLEKNHFLQGAEVRLQLTALSGENRSEKLLFFILNDANTVVREGTFGFSPPPGLSRWEFPVGTSKLLAGDYRLRLISPPGTVRQEIPFTILPVVNPAALTAKREKVKDRLSVGSYTTLQFREQEIRGELAALKPYDTARRLRKAIEDFLFLVREAENGRDVLGRKTGLLRRAYRSRVDSTLQPYTMRIPRNIRNGQKFPLLVFLHGSGTDDCRALKEWPSGSPGSFIELAPFGRGTSNAFSTALAQQDIQEAIEDVVAHYPVDTSRIVLAGFSMGGYGVFRTFWEHPGRFRALAVFSGHPDLANRWGIPGTHPNFLQPENLTVFRGVPVFIFHGMRDRNCPFELTERLVNALQQAGAKVTFYFEENKGHERPGKEVMRQYDRWLQEVVRSD